MNVNRKDDYTMSKLIITVAPTGAAVSRKTNPYVPVSPEEIAENVVSCARAGASIAHLHARDAAGNNTMDPDFFSKICSRTREACATASVDIILSITTSGSGFSDEAKVESLLTSRPEMCSFEAGALNWENFHSFKNAHTFLDKLGALTQQYDIKPEIEILDAGMLHNLSYFISNGTLRQPLHIQFVLGAFGAMPGNIESLAYLLPKLPTGSTWSIAGIGKSHVPMMLAGLAAGCTGLRVGIEDCQYLEHGILATNKQLVGRAVRMAEIAGREIATADEARRILGIPKK
jgi:3-keto-5-aminohexanoate cleavage enzyme